jgi:hypothetical protein
MMVRSAFGSGRQVMGAPAGRRSSAAVGNVRRVAFGAFRPPLCIKRIETVSSLRSRANVPTARLLLGKARRVAAASFNQYFYSGAATA